MKYIILIMALVVTGCSDYPEYRTIGALETTCDDKAKEQVSSFTLACIKNANPSSDEEPEDWILLCKKMATDNYCTQESVLTKQENMGHGWRTIEIIRKAMPPTY